MILVTGGCGFIGSNFINWYLDTYPTARIVNIDRVDYCAKEDNVHPCERYTFVKGDINDMELVSSLLNTYQPEYLVHFAAQSHVDNSFGNSIQFTRDNIMGTHTLLECTRKYGKLKRFLHMSTDEVYGEVSIDHPGCDELSVLNPTNPYAATKSGAELITRSYFYSFKLPVVVVRCNNVYGPNQYPEKLIPKFADLIKKGYKCPVHGDGSSRRNFIHAFDVSRALGLVLFKGELNTVYNIGTTNEYTVLEITQKLLDILRPGEVYTNWIEFVEDRVFNDFRYSVDSTKLRALGWEETVRFNQGLVTLCQLVET
jgi:dTDP-glucose 4,6-dehydratase